MEGTVPGKSDIEIALRSTVEQAQPDQLCRHIYTRCTGTVDEENAVQRAVGYNLVVCIQMFGLQYQRDIVDAVGARKFQFAFDAVAHDDEPGNAFLDMFIGLFVQVRMVPMRGGRIEHREGRPPGAVFGDHHMRAAVVFRSHMHAVPVDGRRFAEAVLYMHVNLLPAPQDDRGSQQVSVGSESSCRFSGFELYAAWLQVQGDIAAAERIGYPQGVLSLQHSGECAKGEERKVFDGWHLLKG